MWEREIKVGFTQHLKADNRKGEKCYNMKSKTMQEKHKYNLQLKMGGSHDVGRVHGVSWEQGWE